MGGSDCLHVSKMDPKTQVKRCETCRCLKPFHVGQPFFGEPRYLFPTFERFHLQVMPGLLGPKTFSVGLPNLGNQHVWLFGCLFESGIVVWWILMVAGSYLLGNQQFLINYGGTAPENLDSRLIFCFGGVTFFLYSIYIYFLSWAAIIDAGVVLYNMVANKYNTNRLYLTKCGIIWGIMNVTRNKWLWVNWYQTHQMSNHSPPR